MGRYERASLGVAGHWQGYISEGSDTKGHAGREGRCGIIGYGNLPAGNGPAGL